MKKNWGDVGKKRMMSTADVAEGFGCSESTIREHKSQHQDELLPNKHWFTVRNPDAVNDGGLKRNFWTKRGVVRLGFLINSQMAKKFPVI